MTTESGVYPLKYIYGLPLCAGIHSSQGWSPRSRSLANISENCNALFFTQVSIKFEQELVFWLTSANATEISCLYFKPIQV